MTSRLFYYEWCVVVLFCIILLILAFLAFKRPSQPLPLVAISKNFLEVEIQGAVEKPGIYRLPTNSATKELIEQAQLLPNADISQIKWKRKLYDGQTVRILEKTLLTVYIEGAVKRPGKYQIESGTRWQELVDQVEFLPDADLTSLRKKRQFLREGNRVTIPKGLNKPKKVSLSKKLK
jgi:protein involved in polysaccharide export with SLBB domain